MYDWFECKVRYDKTLENDSQKKVVEPYLVDAISWTEAEKRICEEMKPYIRGGFEVVDIKKVKFAELIESDKLEDDRWYKCKLVFTIVDEKSGKEKKATNLIMVKACDIPTAIRHLDEGMKGTLDYVITSVVETPIMDVYHFDLSAAKPEAEAEA